MRLIINGYDIDLSKKDKVKYSIQSNTISDITTRQTNFTPKFKLPKTAKNVKAMENLYLVGNASNIPYQKNSALLYSSTGETIINIGWAVIKDTKKNYNCHIYDGNIDFYKAIENKTLTDIGLSDLNHLKNLNTVIETWTDLSLPYRYNLADYNGNPIYDIDKINIDYLIPSANAKFLWDKIFEYIGWTYSGNAFDLEFFKNLWLTYPKTISSETQSTVPIVSINWEDNITYGTDFFNQYDHNSLIACLNCSQIDNEYFIGSENTIETLDGPETMYNSQITVLQSGLYKIIISGIINNNNGNGTYINLSIGTGGNNTNEIIGSVNYGENFNFVYYKNFEAGEVFRLNQGFTSFSDTFGDVDIDFELVEGNTVDFAEALISFSITDFVREIVVRLGVTPFTDIHNKNVEFLTLDEIIQNQEVDDWSDKYQGKTGESYAYGSYARKNSFKYKYNDKDASYNDGFIVVDNINLKDEKTAFQSKIYSPEREKSTILLRKYHIYKFWNKEVKDDGSIKYKPLENRFYFMNSVVVQGVISVGSQEYQDEQIANVYVVEDFSSLKWNNTLNTFYPAINSIINKSKVFSCLLNLNSFDIKNIDLKKLVYISQEASYFLKNKISNWQEYNPNTQTELIKLDLSVVNDSIVVLNPEIIIFSTIGATSTDLNYNYHIRTDYNFLDYTPTSATITMKLLDASPYDGGVPIGFEYTGNINVSTNSYYQVLPFSAPFNYGWYEVKIVDQDGLESNIEYVYWGDPNTDSSIEISVELIGEIITEEHERDVSYRFNNFSPTSAILKIQPYDFITGNFGAINTVALTNLTADTLHTLTDVLFPNANGLYEVKIITNTITHSQTMLLI